VQVHRIAPWVTAEEAQGASICAQQPEQDPQRGGLAGPVGSQETVDLTRGDVQVELVEDLGPTEALDQADDVDDC
jgi:hypothetical protein